MHNNRMEEAIVGLDNNVLTLEIEFPVEREPEYKPAKCNQQEEGSPVEAGLSTILGNRFCSSLIILWRFSPWLGLSTSVIVVICG